MYERDTKRAKRLAIQKQNSQTNRQLTTRKLEHHLSIKQENIDNRKKASNKSDKKKVLPPIASIVIPKRINRIINDDDQEVVQNPRTICLYCNNKLEFCHNKQYSKYCIKAAYSYLQCNDHGLLAGFSPARMESVFTTAYNEIRRSDMYRRYGYYNPDTLKVPKCMELTSMQVAVDLGYNSQVWDKLEEENEEGKNAFLIAKRDHNC